MILVLPIYTSFVRFFLSSVFIHYFSVPAGVFYFLTCYNNINFHNVNIQQEVLHMKLCDHHLHSEFSDDSETELTDIVEQALHLGMSEICITDHHDIDYPKTRKVIPFC